MNLYPKNRLLCVVAFFLLSVPAVIYAMDEKLKPTLESILTCPRYSPAGKEILTYLPFADIDRIRQVCRQLRTAWNPDSTIYLCCTAKSTILLQKLARIAKEAKNPIHLGLNIQKRSQLIWLLNHANDLRNLNIVSLSFNCRDFSKLGKLCSLWPNVKKLLLHGSFYMSVPSELQKLKQLEVFEIKCSFSPSLTTEAVAQVCTYCPNLKSLCFDSYGHMFIALPPEIQQLKNLTKLSIPYNGYDHETIVSILKMCPQLAELSLICPTYYTKEEREQILELVQPNAPNTRISFVYCH